MIPFNKPPLIGSEEKYVLEAIRGTKISGDSFFGKKCQKWFENYLPCKKALLTPSCTHALELAAMLIDIKEGDEVIMPSYTFVSTANAFVLRGAKIVFVDIRADTMNIDEEKIESAITHRTKAIVPVHYAGVGCNMDKIISIADKYNLFVIEDAAQGMMSTYRGRMLGTIGNLAAFSFHETKNYTSGGEGGLLLINDKKFIDRAEIIREKGTNRSLFFRGMVDKYTWCDIGSSYLPSELQAAYLWGQLENPNIIQSERLRLWNFYYEGLNALNLPIILPFIPKFCEHNAHMFYIKVKNLDLRTQLIQYLNQNGIGAVFHYVPLHSAPFGNRNSIFSGNDVFTTSESEKIIRLPLFYGMTQEEQIKVISCIKEFFTN